MFACLPKWYIFEIKQIINPNILGFIQLFPVFESFECQNTTKLFT